MPENDFGKLCLTIARDLSRATNTQPFEKSMAKLLKIIKSRRPLKQEPEPTKLENVPDEKLRESDLVSLP